MPRLRKRKAYQLRYAKIQDKMTKKWLNYDGTFKPNGRNAYFKILRLEEMV